MKSKTHSKKCVDLGVSVGLIDEQDAEESGKALFHIFHKCCLQCTIFFCIHTLLSIPTDTASFLFSLPLVYTMQETPNQFAHL